MWKDPKHAVHARKSTNTPGLKGYCKEEWAKIHSNNLRTDQWLLKHLVATIAAQGGTLFLKLLSTTVDLNRVSSLWVVLTYQLLKAATILMTDP